jgi:hypothetical protein
MAGKEQQETDEEKATREAEEAKAFEERVTKIVAPIVNKAVTAQISRAQKATDTKLDAIMSKLGAGKGAEGESEGTGENGDGSGDGEGDGGQRGGQPRGADGKLKAKQDPETTARLRKIEGELAAAKKKAEEAEKRNQEMEARRRVDEENEITTKTLLGLGIKDEVQLETALLYHRGKGRIVRDEETGKPLFKRKDKDGDDELVPLEAGLKDWGKTPEAKVFLPPVGGGGSGSQGGGAGKGSNGTGKGGVPTDEQFGQQMANLLYGGGGSQ